MTPLCRDWIVRSIYDNVSTATQILQCSISGTNHDRLDVPDLVSLLVKFIIESDRTSTVSMNYAEKIAIPGQLVKNLGS